MLMNKLARWVPALVAPAVIVGAAIAAPAIASAASPQGTKTPEQVLALIAKSETAAYSGTVTQTSDLGLPDLTALEKQSGPFGASGGGLVDLLTASHTAKVYTNGGAKQRLQVLDTLAERDVVRNGNSVWLYDSSQQQATHLTMSGTDAGKKKSAPDVTPAQLAASLVKQLRPTTDFAVTTSDRIAGRATYRLTLTPKTSGTLVDDATVAVDAKTGVPLEVAVYAKGQAKPAVSVEFSSIRYAKPDASVFRFTPPKGTKVETHKLQPKAHGHSQHGKAPKSKNGLAERPQPKVTGTGWSAIAELPARSLDLSQLGGASGMGGGDAQTLLGLLQSVPGGRGLQTSLVSVLITDDGRALVGAVPLTALENAAR
jgi:outer membrane lipoprotein-sorting protein